LVKNLLQLKKTAIMEEEIKKAVEVLKLGGTILYPTDTIWGIGCDATNYKAVDKINKIKMRSEPRSLIVLVPSIEALRHYVQDVPEVCIDLISSISDPLTIIYQTGRNLAKNVLAPDKSVAVRIPKDDFCIRLLEEFGKPVTASSANISGDNAPLSFSKINLEIKNRVDYVVDYHKEMINRPKASTIVMLTPDGEIQILRN
jgi:L-threonylcarbamoyladenylate synthase